MASVNEIDARLAQTTVLLHRHYELLTHLINTRQKQALSSFERAIASGTQSLENVYEIYNYIHAVIDVSVRYQKIANVLPRISQKGPEVSALNQALLNFKEARNQIQHVNNDIENEYTGPLMGSVCWVNGDSQFLVSLNDIGRQRWAPGIVLDTNTGKFLNEICYILNDQYLDISRAVKGIQDFQAWIDKCVVVEIGGRPFSPLEHYAALMFKFGLPEAKPGSISE